LCPFVLLDGHQSRFDEVFLRYINDPAHKWVVAIGVPYGTHIWQVGDSSFAVQTSFLWCFIPILKVLPE
jgi:hypothetical protein